MEVKAQTQYDNKNLQLCNKYNTRHSIKFRKDLHLAELLWK